MYAASAESFGKQWGPGDVVGVFLDLVDHTISKIKKVKIRKTKALIMIHTNFLPIHLKKNI